MSGHEKHWRLEIGGMHILGLDFTDQIRTIVTLWYGVTWVKKRKVNQAESSVIWMS